MWRNQIKPKKNQNQFIVMTTGEDNKNLLMPIYRKYFHAVLIEIKRLQIGQFYVTNMVAMIIFRCLRISLYFAHFK